MQVSLCSLLVQEPQESIPVLEQNAESADFASLVLGNESIDNKSKQDFFPKFSKNEIPFLEIPRSDINHDFHQLIPLKEGNFDSDVNQNLLLDKPEIFSFSIKNQSPQKEPILGDKLDLQIKKTADEAVKEKENKPVEWNVKDRDQKQEPQTSSSFERFERKDETNYSPMGNSVEKKQEKNSAGIKAEQKEIKAEQTNKANKTVEKEDGQKNGEKKVEEKPKKSQEIKEYLDVKELKKFKPDLAQPWFFQNTPLLGLLSGQNPFPLRQIHGLETREEIPHWIMENPLVTKAMSTDMKDFFSKPMAMKDILHMFDIPPKELSLLEAKGLPLEHPPLSMVDFLKTMDFDPHVAFQALEGLQNIMAERFSLNMDPQIPISHKIQAKIPPEQVSQTEKSPKASTSKDPVFEKSEKPDQVTSDGPLVETTKATKTEKPHTFDMLEYRQTRDRKSEETWDSKKPSKDLKPIIADDSPSLRDVKDIRETTGHQKPQEVMEFSQGEKILQHIQKMTQDREIQNPQNGFHQAVVSLDKADGTKAHVAVSMREKNVQIQIFSEDDDWAKHLKEDLPKLEEKLKTQDLNLATIDFLPPVPEAQHADRLDHLRSFLPTGWSEGFDLRDPGSSFGGQAQQQRHPIGQTGYSTSEDQNPKGGGAVSQSLLSQNISILV